MLLFKLNQLSAKIGVNQRLKNIQMNIFCSFLFAAKG